MTPLTKVLFDDAVEVEDTSTLILPANPRRKWATFVNASDTDIWLRFGSAAEVDRGIYVSSGGFGYEIGPDNLWTGEVYGIHAAAAQQKTLARLEIV